MTARVRAGAVVLVLVAAIFAITLRGRPAHRVPARCPTWEAMEAGHCLARPWTLQASADGIAEQAPELRGLAIDGSGRGLAVWTAQHAGRSAVVIAEEGAHGTWSTRNPAARLDGQDTAIALAAGADRAAVATWVHAGDTPGVAVSERDATGWRDPGAGDLLSLPPGAVEPSVAIGPAGEQVVAWCQATSKGWGIAVAQRVSAGAPWVRPRGADDVVSPDILFANQPELAIDAHGDALVAWYQSEGVPLMTYVSERRGREGAFSRPGAHDHLSAMGAPVASDPIANPKPAMSSTGEAAVAWVQENGAGATPVYLATRDVAGSWSRPRDLADSFSRPVGVAHSARVAFGPGGDLYILWVVREGSTSRVFAAHRAASGRWLEPGTNPVTLSGDVAYGPVLAVGPSGAVLAAWIEQEDPRDERVAVRRTGVDRAQWERREWLTPSGSGHVAWVQAAMGPGDRALVGWVAGLRDARILFARVE